MANVVTTETTEINRSLNCESNSQFVKADIVTKHTYFRKPRCTRKAFVNHLFLGGWERPRVPKRKRKAMGGESKNFMYGEVPVVNYPCRRKGYLAVAINL